MRTAKFKISRIELRAKNRIYIIPEQDDIYDANDILELIRIMEGLVDSQPYSIVMLLKKTQLMLTRDARHVFRNNLEVQKLVLAEAIVTDSMSSMILFNLISKVYPPAFPFKAFKHETDANKWLDAVTLTTAG
ncbi:MAG: hypothetical protein JKX84_06835 [Flavobacteriales bacterium]|nr:hypothetical protein [Flavobacteriales bacterium]